MSIPCSGRADGGGGIAAQRGNFSLPVTATRDSGTLVRALLPHHWRLGTRLTAAMVVVLGLLLGCSLVSYGQLQRQRRGGELGHASAITDAVGAELGGFAGGVASSIL